MKRGVKIPMEPVRKEEQEELMAAVKYGNKKNVSSVNTHHCVVSTV